MTCSSIRGTRVPVAVVLALSSSMVASRALASEAKQLPTGATVLTNGPFGVLALRLNDEGLLAKSCASPKAGAKSEAACTIDDATTFHFPASARTRLAEATLQLVKTKTRHEVVIVTVPTDSDRLFRVALAPDGDDAPHVVWSGFTGAGNELSIDKDGTGETLHLTTTFSLCGHPFLGADRTLDPTTLVLVGKKLPDPVADLRKTAAAVKGEVAMAPAATFAILHATGATSGSAKAATDGDTSTAWIPESQGYEAITFDGAPSVEAAGLRITFQAPTASAPRAALVVADDKAFALDIPSDRGATIVATSFGGPLRAKCWGVVLGPPPEKSAPIGITDVSLTTALDGKDLHTLARSLDGAGAAQSMALLSSTGKEGVMATAAVYADLGPSGQELARHVIDSGTCADKLDFYVPLLAAKDRDEADRAHERVAECGKDAIAPLVAQIESQAGDKRAVFAEELGLLSPRLAVPALVRGLGKSDAPADRLVYRRGLVKASKRERSVEAFDTALASDTFASLSPIAQIDVLRGMGERLGETKAGPDAFEKLWKASATDFQARYLLLGPASELAKKAVPFAENVLELAITKDADPHIRAHAAGVANGNAAAVPALRIAAADTDPRVREAAGRALATSTMGLDVQRMLATALAAEAWTFVKRASLSAIANATDAADVDTLLTKAMDTEEQPIVRSDILTTLGTRGAKSARADIQARVADDGEAIFVRVAAVEALGGLCDTASLGDLTNLAQRGKAPGSETEARLAMAAIKALGRLHPSDLKDRLAPVLGDKVIADVRASAHAALTEEHTCSAH